MLARDDAPAETAGAEDDASLRRMSDRVESLIGGFDTVSTPRQARELGEELARTIVTLYGAAIERLLTVVHDVSGEGSPEVFARLCEDPLLESVLCLHGLHPYSIEQRVQLALDGVRPYLKSHEGDITIAGVADGVVTLRLHGTCDGCPSSELTVKQAVERAILARVPEIVEVRAENLTPLRDEGPDCPVVTEDAEGRTTILLGV
jgi:Fe-S cluster biogenesis protein NfuA